MEPLRKIADFQPTRRALSLLDEFKAFAFKGNVIDLAVGVIIGAAFGKIVESLVKNIVLPVIGLILPGEMGYENWKLDLGGGKVLPYGLFIGDVVSFLIIAAVLFIFIVKFLGWLMSFQKKEEAAPPPLTKQEELLTEIRDLLKKAHPAPEPVAAPPPPP